VKKSHKSGLGADGEGNTGRRKTITRFFSIAQVAELLGVSIRTVRRWIKKKKLARHKFGAVVRVAEDDLRAFLAAHWT